MLMTTLIVLLVFVIIFAVIAGIDIYKSKKRKEQYRKSSIITSFLMLLPASLLAFIFVLLPIIYSLGYAFTDFYLLRPNDINFIGFQNF